MSGGSAPARNYRGLLRVHTFRPAHLHPGCARDFPGGFSRAIARLDCSSGYRAYRQFTGRDLHPLVFETQKVSPPTLNSTQTSFRAALTIEVLSSKNGTGPSRGPSSCHRCTRHGAEAGHRPSPPRLRALSKPSQGLDPAASRKRGERLNRSPRPSWASADSCCPARRLARRRRCSLTIQSLCVSFFTRALIRFQTSRSLTFAPASVDGFSARAAPVSAT